ncbi:MAG TPA: DUF1684 domain-containing protein [Bryobacteraceae bacterium]|nr:DUF1684 domain-containing protein [Bryobacteraceae bacterium]
MHARRLLHICVALAAFAPAVQSGDPSYRESIEKWRVRYEADLKQDNGWLALAGLFWLKEGDNTFGSGPGNDLVLPSGSAPESAGTFVFNHGATRVLVREGVPASFNGQPIRTAMPLQPDATGKPDRVTLGQLSMVVIKRGGRYAVRLWDNNSPARRSYQGSHWFPIQEAYRITAQFTSYPQPRMIPILNVLGQTEPSPSPGFATFDLNGKRCRLEPMLEDNRLFFVFKDLTSGNQTYAAGRFLYAPLPKDGQVVLDFNQATNPPCAFTAYATCPLPPRQNWLAVAVPAGEKTYSHAKSSD